MSQPNNKQPAPPSPRDIPLGLYIHLPWCEKKCPYCDFNSHAIKGAIPEADYVRALLADLAQEASHAGGRSIESIFIGGGTPSLFSAEAIARVLDEADALIGLSPAVEVTLESNPGSAEAGRFADYRKAGVNRLSIGVQSFDDSALQALGRIHTADQARAAIRAARGAGFERINVDLMFGLPGQSQAGAQKDLHQALALEIDHLSHYELTLEPNTVFYSRPPELPDDEHRWEMQQACAEDLQAAGLERYEISAWARPGQACAHNLNYWRFGDYLAIGAGAHGKHTLKDGGIWLNQKHRIPERFMALAGENSASVKRHELSPANRRFEFMLNALRLVHGFSEVDFEQRTGLSRREIQPILEGLETDGLMTKGPNGAWQPTARGLDWLNEMQARFLPEPEDEKR